MAAPQGTTGKAGGLAPTRAKMGGMPWRSGVPWPAPPPRTAAPASASAPAAPPLMVSTPKVTSPVAPPVLIAPKSLALNKQVFLHILGRIWVHLHTHIFLRRDTTRESFFLYHVVMIQKKHGFEMTLIQHTFETKTTFEALIQKLFSMTIESYVIYQISYIIFHISLIWDMTFCPFGSLMWVNV